MLVNNKSERVKFISYSGKYPNLCSGVLILEIDGKEYKFGHNYNNYKISEKRFIDEEENSPNFDCFWSSGGYISKDYVAHQGEWIIDSEMLPSQFQELAFEINKIFNENVPRGCCGGCI